MDENGTLILALIALVAMSAFFSASETAYTSLNRARLKAMVNGGNRRAAKVLALAVWPRTTTGCFPAYWWATTS